MVYFVLGTSGTTSWARGLHEPPGVRLHALHAPTDRWVDLYVLMYSYSKGKGNPSYMRGGLPGPGNIQSL